MVRVDLTFPLDDRTIRQPSNLLRGLRALTPIGNALLASEALQSWVDAMEERRVVAAGQRIGLDLSTVEGRLAATAYALIQEGISSGAYSVLPKRSDMARIGAEAAALFNLMHPDAILETGRGGDPETQRALWDFIASAGDAYEQGRLRLLDEGLAEGWVEVFPDLTDDELRLGQIEGFLPKVLEGWRESYGAEDLGLDPHTGGPVPVDPGGSVVSTPVPEESGPFVLEARPKIDFVTPGGNIVPQHGANESGQEYIEGRKGHTAAQIDEIIANPDPERSGYLRGKGRLKGERVVLLTGQDGHWVKLDGVGRVIAASNRYLPLHSSENDPGEIMEPLGN